MATRQPRPRSRLLLSGEELPSYTPKHVHACKNNNMCGCTLPQLVRFLWRYGRYVEFRTYWVRLLFLVLMATLNSCFAAVEWLFYAGAINRARYDQRPVFVIGTSPGWCGVGGRSLENEGLYG